MLVVSITSSKNTENHMKLVYKVAPLGAFYLHFRRNKYNETNSHYMSLLLSFCEF